MTRDKLTKANQSIEKALMVIEVLARQHGPMRLQDLSDAVEMPASTISRLLTSLGKHRYVNQDPDTHRYSLTLKFAQIGALVKSQFRISEAARPYMKDLSIEVEESVCLAIEQDSEVVYVDTVDGPDSMLKTMQRIGKRAPLHSTGVGKVLLLNFNPQEIERIAESTGLKPLTYKTITDKQRLIEAVESIRTKGYAIDDEECEIGARCVAAPIWDYSGIVVAAISVSGPATRMTIAKIESIRDSLLRVANEISRTFCMGGNEAISRDKSLR